MLSFDVEQSLLPNSLRFSDGMLRRVRQAFSRQLPKVSGIIHIHIVDETEIRRLNRMHRGKDKVTDVLSFPLESPYSEELGDVLICMAQALRQSEGDDELELLDLLVHGILHVLGYDHEDPADAQQMFPLQDALVAEILRSL